MIKNITTEALWYAMQKFNQKEELFSYMGRWNLEGAEWIVVLCLRR
jgi:hypothetical protein